MAQSENKVVIETVDGQKKVEFTPEEFSEVLPLIVKKFVDGKLVETRIIKVTNNQKLIMN